MTTPINQLRSLLDESGQQGQLPQGTQPLSGVPHPIPLNPTSNATWLADPHGQTTRPFGASGRTPEHQRQAGQAQQQPLQLSPTSTKPLTLQPFDKADWDIWAGAERPIDSEPLVSYDVAALGFDETSIATVLVDANGIEIYLTSEEVDNQVESWYELEVEWPDSQAIIAQMSQPLTPAMLRRFMFVKVN